jgi:hypothetical protein
VKLAGLAPGVAVCGEKVTVAPGGNPAAVRATGKLNGPSNGVSAKLKVAALPGTTVWLVELAELFGVAITLKSSMTWGNVVEVLLVKFESPE